MFMKKTSLLAAAAVLALTSGVAFAAPGTSTSGHQSQARVIPVQDPAAVLYDQNDNDSGIGITSQNFEASFDIYDNMGADDFTVPAGEIWLVKQVDVTGVYYNGFGPADSQHVAFYKNKNGLPGRLVADFPAVVGTDNGTGSFAITLPSKVKLKAGKYWVGVAANMDFAVGGQWGFETRTVQNGNPAAWQNPGDGFGTGCTTWNYENVCIAAGQGPDKMFRLLGKSKPAQ
jgi:hypothetical protein